jgi:hypothetical protein
VTVTSGSSGTGSGVVHLEVAANQTLDRQGTLTVAGKTVSISQSRQSGAPALMISFRSQPGDWVGQGQTGLYLASSNVYASGSSKRSSIALAMENAPHWYLNIATAGSAALVSQQLYEDATGSVVPTLPLLTFSGDSRGCGGINGRFIIGELQWNSDGSLKMIHVAFEHHCNSAALFGEVWYDANGAQLPPTTLELPPAPSFPKTLASFQIDSGTSYLYSLNSMNFSALQWQNGISVNINSFSPGEFWSLIFVPPTSQTLQVGSYSSAGWPATTTNAGMSVGGPGCTSSPSSFQVLELVRDVGGAILRFHVTFDAMFAQSCVGTKYSIHGEVYIVADPWR